MKKRLFALALHGLGSYYLDPLLAQGRLPHIQALMAQGNTGSLLSPFPISAASWVTMFTGQTVGHHGAVDYVQVDARSYHGTHARLADNCSYRDNTIFSVASAHGLRVAALFLPMTYPPWAINGIMVSGFPLPDDRRPPTYPPGLAQQIGTIAPARLLSLRYENKAAIAHYLEHTLSRIEEVTLKTWREGEFDLFFACIPVPDLAHHYFWTRDDPEALERLNRVYELVDATVGRYANAVGDHAYMAVFSDHGGGPAPARRFYVNQWLAEQDLLHVRSSSIERLGLVAATNYVIEQARRFRVHQALRSVIRGPVREGVLSLTHNDAFVDWKRSRAYGVHFFYPLVGVEINLAGRQKRGIVAAGREYESLRNEICAGLERLVDPETGQRVCERVCLREDMFHGPHLELLPDVVAVLHPDYDGKVRLGPGIFADNELEWEYPFMGYHSREAFFALRGPGIAARCALPQADMTGLAPTLLHLLDVPIPAFMEGSPLPVSFLDEPAGLAD
jgi:predicted AlkP superfamily phosphohydrolase/phosphomutase